MIKQMKAAIFDMDGTLIDSLIWWDELWDFLGNKFLGKPFRPDKEADKAVRTMTLKDAMYYIHEQYHIGAGGEELYNIADQMLADFYSHTVQLKKGVLAFLTYCHAMGVQMCIASAGSKELVEMALSHCKIDSYFSKIFSCGDIGKGKDQPDIYLQALHFLGTKKEETFVFEDSAVAVQTAYELGFNTVAIYDAYNYGQDYMKETATEYIAKGETLERLIHS